MVGTVAAAWLALERAIGMPVLAPTHFHAFTTSDACATGGARRRRLAGARRRERLPLLPRWAATGRW